MEEVKEQQVEQTQEEPKVEEKKQPRELTDDEKYAKIQTEKLLKRKKTRRIATFCGMCVALVIALVLIILAAVVSFVTQLISMLLMKPKGQKLPMMNKIMMAIIPITMIILASTSNVIYTLYVIVNSLITAIISTIISMVSKKINKKYEGNEQLLLKKKNVEVVEYSRNYKKK